MNRNSKVLALKYRPSNFNELIGQEIVSETIINSIKSNKIPNAYLFTGIRGVGKTTIARIVAKSLNCKNGVENLCTENICDNCQGIIESNHMDVMEIDAASNTGVDNVRELIEFSRYGPTSSKYKIFIIDEVHMLSKQAFNALLKTLEEPPDYLKFIFATTEIKKIPVTVVSRCQRFDLSRVRSTELFNFIKKIKDKENGKATDDVIKLIVKISEGSVRDALSLLDRGLLTLGYNKELDLKTAQKIFGYFDKSQLIDLFKLILLGEEKKVIENYRKIYDQGIEPKVFINDFLELLYYFKNIDLITLEGTNFSLNDEEFKKIKDLSKNVNSQLLILYWQFTIKTLDELDIVTNQNLSIEMFLMRLIYLHSPNQDDQLSFKNDLNFKEKNKFENKIEVEKKNEVINQIKNITQEKKSNPKLQLNIESEKKKNIQNFSDLLKICNEKKEIKLKYDLEKNVNLVSFDKNRIEISFNDDLDKDFIKILSGKLFLWTNERWIISLSKSKGQISIKDQKKIEKKRMISKIKDTSTYKAVMEKFPDAKLNDLDLEKNKD